MDVVVLAGGRCPADLRDATGVEFRATLPVRGRPMVAWVIEAVAHLGKVIAVGGPPGLSPHQLEAGTTFIESLGRGLQAVTTDSFLLVTGDLPFLTANAVDDFISRCDPEAMLNFPVIDVRDSERAFPGMRRTSIKTREGRFTGGNIALLQAEPMRAALPVMEQAYANRKKPLRLAGMVGLGTLLAVAAGQLVPSLLPLSRLEKAVGKCLGQRVRAVVSPFPEIGADIDTLEQYRSISGNPEESP